MAARPELRRGPGRARLAALALAAWGCAQPAARPSAAPAAPPGDAGPGTQHDLPAAASPLVSAREVARRALTPLTFRELERSLAAGGKALQEPVEPAREQVALYVPPGAPPPRGWGLLVYIAPWEEATRPRRWRSALDRHGLLFASVAGAGNQTGILDRRLPMAVVAAETVRAHHPVDPERVYVGGMSGGSRAALAAALAYPDLFRGVLLNAGSEPIDGGGGIYLPPADLFRRFQATRLVYATGEKDEEARRADEVSRLSMRRRCVLDVEVQVAYRLGHEPLDRPSWERALAALDRRAGPDPAALRRCNEALARELEGRLAEAGAALDGRDASRARDLLQGIDAAYGGLAAPAIVELEERREGMR